MLPCPTYGNWIILALSLFLCFTLSHIHKRALPSSIGDDLIFRFCLLREASSLLNSLHSPLCVLILGSFHSTCQSSYDASRTAAVKTTPALECSEVFQIELRRTASWCVVDAKVSGHRRRHYQRQESPWLMEEGERGNLNYLYWSNKIGSDLINRFHLCQNRICFTCGQEGCRYKRV